MIRGFDSMTVRRIVANLHAADPGKAPGLLSRPLGLDLVMDQGLDPDTCLPGGNDAPAQYRQ